MNPQRWLRKHSIRLLAIRDTPEAIAGGVAIGIFFGFTPLFGLKTVLAVLFAWLTGSNILAAVIAGALHNVILPFMPVIYRWEYQIGFWLVNHPHRLPPSITSLRWEHHAWHDWRTILRVGKPLLVGSLVVGTPFSALTFWFTRGIVRRHQLKRQARSVAVPEPNDNPS